MVQGCILKVLEVHTLRMYVYFIHYVVYTLCTTYTERLLPLFH